MNFMKQKTLYAIVVIVIIAVVILGWYYFSSVGQYIYGTSACPRWKCTDKITYTCPSGTTNYSCSSNTLMCYICSTSYVTKIYNVTLMSILNTTYNYYINGEYASLSLNQSKTLSDGTVFGVTSSIAFYLRSSYETKYGSVTLPPPSSTAVSLIVSTTPNCTTATYSCPSGYTPSCSGSTLTCTDGTSFICSDNQPFSWCTRSGSCKYCPT